MKKTLDLYAYDAREALREEQWEKAQAFALVGLLEAKMNEHQQWHADRQITYSLTTPNDDR